MPDIKHGIEVIKNNVKIAPVNPGVYRMLDKNGKVLYVGKAKSIKKRIVAYTHFDKLPDHIKRMVSEVDRMEFIIVENEAKALLMENDLIKKLEPKYNILLKDDKTFPHLMINPHDEFPALLHKGERVLTNAEARAQDAHRTVGGESNKEVNVNVEIKIENFNNNADEDLNSLADRLSEIITAQVNRQRAVFA